VRCGRPPSVRWSVVARREAASTDQGAGRGSTHGFLASELTGGRLGDDYGRDEADAVGHADDYLAAAAAAAVTLGDVLSAAQSSLASLH
jgi:hypothetical protein